MASNPVIDYVKLDKNAIDPIKLGHDEDPDLTAGFNLYSLAKVRINANNFAVIPTGIAISIPRGFWGSLRACSGLAARTGLIVNAGVIDASYRGEIKVVMNNPTGGFVDIKPGDKIAQLIIELQPSVSMKLVEKLDETKRGTKGFGSTECTQKQK